MEEVEGHSLVKMKINPPLWRASNKHMTVTVKASQGGTYREYHFCGKARMASPVIYTLNGQDKMDHHCSKSHLYIFSIIDVRRRLVFRDANKV